MQMRLTSVLKRTVGPIAGLAVLAAIAYLALFLAGYRPVVVYSGSMEPGLPVGTLAFVESVPAESIHVGDVITFGDPHQPGRLVTHRVVETTETDQGELAFRTKGDANLNRDPWAIALPDEAGRLAFDVPYVGYALWYAKTREVRMGLILLLSGLVLAFLLQAIWRKPDAPAEAPAR
jgi:signal peptidase I